MATCEEIRRKHMSQQTFSFEIACLSLTHDQTIRATMTGSSRSSISENYPSNPALMRAARITGLYRTLAEWIKELVHRFLHYPFPLSMTDYPSVIAQHEVPDL